MLRRSMVATAVAMPLLFAAGPALACGGLIGPNGAVNLGRTTTLAAYTNGVEHYVTGFSFVGAGAAFGSIIPLPDVPTKVIKGGEWTLQRLLIEVAPPAPEALAFAADSAAGASRAEVILEAKVDSLDITVLRGGGDEVGLWAKENGFNLSPDAPEVLDFYGERSPIFMAVRFDPDRAAAQGIQQGQSTPVHVVIPTDDPWVPLRILALGKQAIEPVQADVFLLTDREPATLPSGNPLSGEARDGLTLSLSTEASDGLLADLRSDRGMSWLPESGMWLSYFQLDAPAGQVDYDLAIDADGWGRPSPVDAGYAATSEPAGPDPWISWSILGALAIAAAMMTLRRRPAGWAA